MDLQKVLYTDVRASYGLKSQMAIHLKTVLARYKTVSELMKRETVTYAADGRHDAFRKSLGWLQKPVVFRRPQADLVRGRDWGFTAGMEMVSVNTLEKRIKCTYQCRPDSRLFDPAWKHGGAKLVFHDTDRNWYLHISITKAFPDTGRSRITEIYGHDRGLVNLVTFCGDNGETVFQDGQDVHRIKERYARTRASLQAKGTKGARQVLKRISGRENRMMSDVDHCISKTLVSGCRAGALHVFEDLSGVSFQNLEDRNASGRYELRSWTFYSLEMKTAYKAAMRRGAILKVNPQYTSQKCPDAGRLIRQPGTAASTAIRASTADAFIKMMKWQQRTCASLASGTSVEWITRIFPKKYPDIKYPDAKTKIRQFGVLSQCALKPPIEPVPAKSGVGPRHFWEHSARDDVRTR